MVGGGGREHAIAWRLAQDPEPPEIFAAPGNPGIAQVATCIPLSSMDVDALIGFAQGQRIDLTVIGPELPLLAGLVDRFTAAGLAAVGPTAAAAELEGSKAFCKSLLRTHAIPTGEGRVFTEFDKARAHIVAAPGPMVVKADGLCAGKGVVVCDDAAEALAAAERMLVHGVLGPPGRRILIEERLQGEELSVFALTDGEAIYRFGEARDHKRLLDGDKGPNTGGMGAVSPVAGLPEGLLEQVEREILVPIIHALKVEGRPYRGILYAGLMLTPGGPKVLEFNVRFGDPEAQALLPRLEGSFGDALARSVHGGLEGATLSWSPRTAATVVLASPGYPDRPQSGAVLEGLEEAAGPDALVFHAGTALRDGRLVAAGGRVLTVTGLGKDLEAARAAAYRAADRIRFPGVQLRRDIGLKASPAEARA